MLDPYGVGSATGAMSVTPSDTDEIDKNVHGVFVGVAGDLAVVMKDEQEVVFKGASGLLPICAKKIKASGTTATDIVVVW